MDLFSCRNCVQNPTQGLMIGRGNGFCLQWNSLIREPDQTTCKYHHRKDLPIFLVEESAREHAAEFAGCPGMANLQTRLRVPKTEYSEKYRWEHHLFDPNLNGVAAYHPRSDEPAGGEERKWRLIQAYAGSIDGRKALIYASLFRRYMQHCDSWWSSYRFALSLVEELSDDIYFRPADLVDEAAASDPEEAIRAARWEVLFAKLSGIQEFGWHASLENLKSPMSHLAEEVAEDDWPGVLHVLNTLKPDWQEEIIRLAKQEGHFSPEPRDERP